MKLFLVIHWHSTSQKPLDKNLCSDLFVCNNFWVELGYYGSIDKKNQVFYAGITDSVYNVMKKMIHLWFPFFVCLFYIDL